MLKIFKRDDSHEFRPILAEIEESPVSPLGRTTFWIIIVIIFSTILWITLGQVDVVISARGKIIPDGNIKVLQPLDTGVISNILVSEGDYVHKGQVLMEIDPSTTRPQLESMKKNLNYIELETKRLNAASEGTSFIPVLPTISLDDSAAKTQNDLYNSSMASLEKQIEAKRTELKKTDEEIKSAQAAKANYENLLSLSQDKQNRLKAVEDIIAKDDLIKVAEDIQNYTTQLKSAEYKLLELNHQKDQTLQEMAYVQANFKSENLKELSDRQKQTVQMQANIEEVSFKSTKQKIVSPVDGYINSLLIHTVGGVVTPAEKLITVVPKDSPLLIQAIVQNKDIGFIEKNMPVSLKIDTFNFQKYGILKGQVQTISKDAIEDPKQGPVYQVYITPIDKSLTVEGKREYISTGMSLTAEIKTGKRRIIEFFIYPLIKYLNESISVR